MAAPATISPVYPLGTTVSERDHLCVAGCDLVELAAKFGTPAYVYSEDDIRARARTYLEAFRSRTDDFEVIYASKAFPATAVNRVLAEEGLSIDVASGGELHLALLGGFAPERIFMHGNNKSRSDLERAFEAGIGYLVLDSLAEIELAEELLAARGGAQDVLMRLTPGIRPTTHSSVQTGQLDSKFGFGLGDGDAVEGARRVSASERLRLVGVHAHIGSQILELDPYRRSIEALVDFIAVNDVECHLLNVGGGLGIAYTAEDHPPSIEEYVQVKVEGVRSEIERAGLAQPRILVEPGRSLVGNAGVTIYRVGTIKEVPGVRTYVAVDGGMSDNLRPMLYGARYEALVANRTAEPATCTATIAGMHCESGDILITDAQIAPPRTGDVLVTPATGAYGYAMANNYNGVPRPPVVFCSEGQARLVVRRETVEELTSRDV